jgi:uncharacterized protein YkwD
MVHTQKRPATIHHKKRVGQHHKQSRHYLKVYWPYAPILLIIGAGLFSAQAHPSQSRVLSYATQMSSSALLDSTNQQRTANSEQPLKLNDELSAAAQTKANDMVNRDYWSHVTPDGKAPWTFIQAAGYSYQKAGENLAYGFITSADAVNGWMNSPTHRENILDKDYTEVGFGFANSRYYNKTGPETVVVAMYATPYGVPLAAAQNTQSYNTSAKNSTSVAEPNNQSISWLQTVTKGRLPWISFAVGLASGAAVVFIVIKHGLAIKKYASGSEQFIVHHPLLDIILVILVMTGYVATRASGLIL